MNADKTEYRNFIQRGDISTLNGGFLKLVNKFTYLGSRVSSTENDINTLLEKAWTTTGRLSVIWKSYLSVKLKHSFFQAVVVSIMLYGCTTRTVTTRMEKKLDGNYTRILWAVLNKSWRQHPTKLELFGHISPITKSIKARRTRHAGHCWRSKSELISNVLLKIPLHWRANVGRRARIYLQQLGAETVGSLEDLPGAMDDRDGWQEGVWEIRASSTTCCSW